MAVSMTPEHIRTVVEGLAPQYRAMIKLVLLQYLDLSKEDIEYVAGDRPDPRFQQGQRPLRLTASLDSLKAVEDRANQYRSQVRQRRERIWLQIQCLTRQIAIGEAMARVAEDLLRTRFEVDADTLRELKRTARTAVPRPAVRALDRQWDRDEIEEDAYLKARLPIEYQTELRRLERYRTRLNQAKRELDTVGKVPLQDHEIAHVWGIPLGSLAGRKVKALHQYLQSLQTTLQQAGALPQTQTGPPVDLWKETFETLATAPIERSVAVYDGLEGSEAKLLDKLTAFSTGRLPDELESRLWQAISRDYAPNAVEGQGVRQSLFALQRLLAILNEMDLTPEALEEQLLTRVAPTPKVVPGEEPEAATPQLGEMAEHVLRSMRGGDTGA